MSNLFIKMDGIAEGAQDDMCESRPDLKTGSCC